MPFVRLAPFLALLGLTACGGRIPADDEPTDAASAMDAPGVCTWSSSFEPADATPARDSCRAARAFLVCTSSDGQSNLACISNDLKQCPGPNPMPSVTWACENQCKATEFGVDCGAIGGASVVPPADCRLKAPAPGGIVSYCCTCSP